MRMVFEFHLRVAALSVAVFHACLFAQNTMQGESVTPVADDLAPEVSWPLHSTLAIVDVPNDFAQRCPVASGGPLSLIGKESGERNRSRGPASEYTSITPFPQMCNTAKTAYHSVTPPSQPEAIASV